MFSSIHFTYAHGVTQGHDLSLKNKSEVYVGKEHVSQLLDLLSSIERGLFTEGSDNSKPSIYEIEPTYWSHASHCETMLLEDVVVSLPYDLVDDQGELLFALINQQLSILWLNCADPMLAYVYACLNSVWYPGYQQLAAKITGMCLELPDEERTDILINGDVLCCRVQESIHELFIYHSELVRIEAAEAATQQQPQQEPQWSVDGPKVENLKSGM